MPPIMVPCSCTTPPAVRIVPPVLSNEDALSHKVPPVASASPELVVGMVTSRASPGTLALINP